MPPATTSPAWPSSTYWAAVAMAVSPDKRKLYVALTRAREKLIVTLALPDAVKQWSMTTLRERLVKIGARIVRHGRSMVFQMAEVMVPRGMFREILAAVSALRPSPAARC